MCSTQGGREVQVKFIACDDKPTQVTKDLAGASLIEVAWKSDSVKP